MAPRVRLRFRQAVAITLGLISIYYFIFGVLPSPILPLNLDKTPSRDLKPKGWDASIQDAYDAFGQSLVSLLTDNRPSVVSLTKTGVAGVIGFSDHRKAPMKRPHLVAIGTSEVKLMRKAHQSLTEHAANISLPFIPGTTGIVSTAGGSHLPVFIISLRMLRRTGSTSPVELFLRSVEEYDQYLCEEVLPSLNARCIIMDDLLKTDKHGSSLTLETYQYKIFSILLSSFEQVLLLDADNFPVKSPDYVFDSEVFQANGLITWPDFWISTASERFFAIQGTTAPPTNLRASTESGQVFVNKRTHASALLVTAYYNYYGPTHYYPLLTQGGPGEGDKETFLAGAAAVAAPFFQVAAPVAILGYVESGKLNGVAMLQHDPVDDHTGAKNPAPFTVHANFPKMDPNTLFGDGSPVVDLSTGKHHRLWGNLTTTVDTFGKDLELLLWAEIRHVACDLGGVFKDWKAVPSRPKQKGTCELVEDHMDIVFPLTD